MLTAALRCLNLCEVHLRVTAPQEAGWSMKISELFLLHITILQCYYSSSLPQLSCSVAAALLVLLQPPPAEPPPAQPLWVM